MKLWIISDLHLDYCPLPAFEPPDADVCIIAGDIFNKGIVPSIQWIAQYIPETIPVVFVSGNHEFYKSSLCQAYENAHLILSNYPNIHFLENGLITLNGFRFIGATLWTDFNLFGNQHIALRHAWNNMNDYKRIKYQKQPYARLTPFLIAQKHYESRLFIENSLNCTETCIVVTHHAPSISSIHQNYRSDLLSAAYASNLDDMILSHQPMAWIHGHIHGNYTSRQDYTLGKTRIIANPRGYEGDLSASLFDPCFVVNL